MLTLMSVGVTWCQAPGSRQSCLYGTALYNAGMGLFEDMEKAVGSMGGMGAVMRMNSARMAIYHEATKAGDPQE